KNDIKVLFGVEANVVNDAVPMVLESRPEPLATAQYIVFDIETTGLSVINNKIIELAGVKMRDGKEIDRFSTLIDPHEKIPYHIQQLTNINDDMVRGQPELEPKLREFIEFIGDDVLVAHNARFDIGFIQANCKALGLPEVKNP
ncbi:PolC-type DNA polymerase III, partial [Halorubrum sp. Atlit-9R]